ncbi:MAG: benzoyl-CoA 2,3-epoxidase subunit BoxB [Calditrichaeota bacterium]|nr:MAG: benzoyl-CoA 2,3-epoxidase subunit BoxB [Calditrichota bacterium]
MSIDLNAKIPNNVNLHEDKKLQRALEHWLPNYLSWWDEVGPEGFQTSDIYLRTAVSVDSGGWAHFDHVKMPDYRWGIFLTPNDGNKTIQYGDHIGEKVWNDVPGEYRKELRRLIVTQADTEPASVEQQRLLGQTAPSLYDMRNLFQVNVEEGRHLWAMVYVLHKHFGKDGREEAEELLTRRSGHVDHPRILQTFNNPMTNWLDFFCFTMFTDRDGKYQLGALAESAFDPLARSCQFMLTEEAHHLFVGETGIRRIVKRTCELMKEVPDGDVTKVGGIPLEVLQKHINHWFSSSMDLFGGENSSNAATYFSSALKGRFNENDRKRHPNATALEEDYSYTTVDEKGYVKTVNIPLRRAMNAVLLDDYVTDCTRALDKWNRTLEKAGVDYRFYLPTTKFHRNVGIYAGQNYTPDGTQILSDAEYKRHCEEVWFPTKEDKEYIDSLMVSVTEPGKFANWIAPPTRGINAQPLDFEYVKFH